MSWPGEYTYCPACASELALREVGGRTRQACPSCGFVHFRNPGVGAAVVLVDGDRILLIKRGPGTARAGFWSIPAGYVDYGESVRDAALRELREETGLEAELGRVLHVRSNFHDPAKLSIGVWFDGRITGGSLAPGDDAVDVGWFGRDELPPLAFPTDVEVLDREVFRRPGRVDFPDHFETRRLRLRPPAMDDAAAMFDAYASDDRVTRHLSWRPYTEQAGLAPFIAEARRDRVAGQRAVWLLEHEGAVVGVIDCRLVGSGLELGYALGADHWGEGLMTEAVSAVTDWGLTVVSRVSAIADVENHASIRVLEKSGFVREGYLRRYASHPNAGSEPRDCWLLARIVLGSAG